MVNTPIAANSVPVPPERHGATSAEAWARLTNEGWCYAGEAALILEAQTLDYRQLRVIHDLVRDMAGGVDTQETNPSSERSRQWVRFTLRDLAAAHEVVRLCSRPNPRSGTGRRLLNVAQLRHACERLRREGVAYPLLEVRFERFGSRLVAVAAGVRFDAANGQYLLASAEERLRRADVPVDALLARILRLERAAVRKDRAYELRFDASRKRE